MTFEKMTLQQGIDEAGSAVSLLWKPEAADWKPPVLADEFVGWRAEQRAWRTTAGLLDLSYHMDDLFIEGKDAHRLLSDVGANNLQSFEVHQAKQFITVAPDGNIIADAILFRWGTESFSLTGSAAAGHWVEYHARLRNYDVDLSWDPAMYLRPAEEPRLFRLQLQGPSALDIAAKVFGRPLPSIKFFHAVEVTLAERSFFALRHGMTGFPGYEFFGDYKHHEYVRSTLLSAGEELGIAPVGALAYATAAVESGWIATPTPAIYTSADLIDYRNALNLYGFEGQYPHRGSFYSPKIEDYYASPWEIGYGKSISFTHDFIGKDALEETKDTYERCKVTLEIDPDDAKLLLGEGLEYMVRFTRDRVERDSELVGVTFNAAYIDPLGTILALALVDRDIAHDGYRVEVVWGDHPGPSPDLNRKPDLPIVHATVRPSPYHEYARFQYRAD